jgi:hypothetical protein
MLYYKQSKQLAVTVRTYTQTDRQCSAVYYSALTDPFFLPHKYSL